MLNVVNGLFNRVMRILGLMGKLFNYSKDFLKI